jgi:carbon storage regulator CsrA
MLVLSRKNREAVIVGGGALNRLLKVTVLHIGADKVKLGFEADADISVLRLEVFERLCASGELGKDISARASATLSADVTSASDGIAITSTAPPTLAPRIDGSL